MSTRRMGVPDGLAELIEELDLDVDEDDLEELVELDLSEKELEQIPGTSWCVCTRPRGGEREGLGWERHREWCRNCSGLTWGRPCRRNFSVRNSGRIVSRR